MSRQRPGRCDRLGARTGTPSSGRYSRASRAVRARTGRPMLGLSVPAIARTLRIPCLAHPRARHTAWPPTIERASLARQRGGGRAGSPRTGPGRCYCLEGALAKGSGRLGLGGKIAAARRLATQNDSVAVGQGRDSARRPALAAAHHLEDPTGKAARSIRAKSLGK